MLSSYWAYCGSKLHGCANVAALCALLKGRVLSSDAALAGTTPALRPLRYRQRVLVLTLHSSLCL